MADWRTSTVTTHPLPDHPELVRLGRKPGLWTYLRSIWERRELATDVPMGELKAQNMDSVLGATWHLLNPLMLIAVYWVMFGLILDVGERGGHNFLAFLSTGIFVFLYTRKSIQSGAKQIVSNERLIRSIKFPRAILPLSAVIGETAALVPGLLAMFAIVLVVGEQIKLTWLLLLPVLALQAMFNLGSALVAARVADRFHDVLQVIPYLMQIWLYLSGVLYPADRFITDPTALAVFELNPAYQYITLARGAILDGTTRGDLWLGAAAWGIGMLVFGLLFFRAKEEEYGRG